MSQDGSGYFQQTTNNHQKLGDRYFRGGGVERCRSPNTTPASTVLNSPDLTAEINYLHQHGGHNIHHHHHHPHHQIKVGRSPVSQHDADSGNSISPDDDTDDKSPASTTNDLCLGGRIIDHSSNLMTLSNSHVIFDDIDEDNWRKYPYMYNDKTDDDFYEKSKCTKIIGKYSAPTL